MRYVCRKRDSRPLLGPRFSLFSAFVTPSYKTHTFLRLLNSSKIKNMCQLRSHARAPAETLLYPSNFRNYFQVGHLTKNEPKRPTPGPPPTPPDKSLLILSSVSSVFSALPVFDAARTNKSTSSAISDVDDAFSGLISTSTSLRAVCAFEVCAFFAISLGEEGSFELSIEVTRLKSRSASGQAPVSSCLRV